MKYRNLLTIGSFLLSAALMSSQTSNPTRPDRGFYPNGSFAAGEFDTINNVNGNIIARVPITNLAPGRGGSQFGVNLTYNSAIYDTTGVVNTATPSGFPVVEQRLKQSEHGGWQLGYQYGLEYETRASAGGVCNTANQPVYKIHKMYLRTPDGSLHPLRLHAFSDDAGDGFYGIGPNKERSCPSENPDTAPSGDLVYTTTDGSFIRVEIGYSLTLPGCTIPQTNSQYWTCRLWRVFLPDGSEVRGYGKRPIIMVDRNGNEVYLSSYVAASGNTVDLIEDQMGRFIEVEKFVSPRKDVVRRLGHGLQTLEWQIHYGTIQSVAGVYYKCGSTATDPYVYCDVTAPFASHQVITKVTFPAQTVGLRPKGETR